MVDSGIGRTELPRLGQRRSEAGALAEPKHRDVREPGAVLALVHPEPFQAPMQIFGECRPRPVLVAEDEHADAARFPIADGLEAHRASVLGCVACSAEDGLELGNGPVPKEGKGDVKVLPDDHPSRKLLGLPLAQAVERVVGEPQGAEEPGTFTAFNASGEFHSRSSRLCARSRHTRWSAVTAARRRIDPRSPGNWNSKARPPSGPSAWR